MSADLFQVLQLIAGLGLLLVALVTAIFALYKINKAGKKNRSQFMAKLYLSLCHDENISDGFFLIEYDKFKYDTEFHNSVEQRKVVSLLSFFDLVCFLRKNKQLSRNDMLIFHYRFYRAYRNQSVSKYINFLEDFYNRVGQKETPFSYFTEYCKKELKL